MRQATNFQQQPKHQHPIIMSSPPKPSGPPRSSGLSLYANLLDPTASTPGSIAKGPVPAPKPEETAAKKNIDLCEPLVYYDIFTSLVADKSQIAALRFHPAKRPLIAQKTKPKPKTSFPKATPAIPDNSTRDGASPATSAVPAAKNTLADWAAADDDVNDYYGGGEKRQRGGRKRKKQKREEHVAAQDWDDIYDPTRPNSYEEYKHSDEKIREVTDWKDRLYAHRRARKAPSEDDSEEEDYRPRMNSRSHSTGFLLSANMTQINLRRLLILRLLLHLWILLRNYQKIVLLPLPPHHLPHLHHHKKAVFRQLLQNLSSLVS